MRGNRTQLPASIISIVSIPAYAGEPPWPTTTRRGNSIYPRVCGGTTALVRAVRAGQGLSPRMRGNRPPYRAAPPPDGSIPAYAGEPASSIRGWPLSPVYPRVCGGTFDAGFYGGPDGRLSPRMRGNLHLLVQHSTTFASIPAYAGEPNCRTAERVCTMVYPRVCGGTLYDIAFLPFAGGLSPRMRGNRVRTLRNRGAPGSIPAYAGEPCQPAIAPPPGKVYPRVCGGTPAVYSVVKNSVGLSPRMRGNLHPKYIDPYDARSIPAYAGEPRQGQSQVEMV